MAGESVGRHVHRALNAGAGFGDDKGGTIAFHPIGAVRAGAKGAVGTVGRRRRRRRLVHQQGQKKEKAIVNNKKQGHQKEERSER